MANNTSPIYTQRANIGFGTITSSITANTKSDGTGTIGTDLVKIFTAGAVNSGNDSFVEEIRLYPSSSVAATATTATTLRAFISTQASGATTNANTFPIGEVSAAAQTADHSTNATFYLSIPVNRRINTAYTILISTHVVAAANTTWQALVFAGDY